MHPSKRTDNTPPPAPTVTLADAERCVLCGMCLTQCPTYAVQRIEGTSPRGRITLMLGMNQGSLDPGNPRLQEHIQGCLGCRACEAICPAQVPFGKLMDLTRAQLRSATAKTPLFASTGRTTIRSIFQQRWHKSLQTLRHWMLRHGLEPLRHQALRRRSWRRAAAHVARLAQRVGLVRRMTPSRHPATRMHTGQERMLFLRHMERLLRYSEHSLQKLPALPWTSTKPEWSLFRSLANARNNARNNATNNAPNRAHGGTLAPNPTHDGTLAPNRAHDGTLEPDVWLFAGCMDTFFTGPDLQATLAILQHLGLRAALPKEQVCCGALERHIGLIPQANALCAENLRTFDTSTAPIIVLDSGCEAELRTHLPPAVGKRVLSLTAFLAKHYPHPSHTPAPVPTSHTQPPHPPAPAPTSHIPPPHISSSLHPAPIVTQPWHDTPVRVALHLPCSMRNVTREAQAFAQWLEQLPGVQSVPVQLPYACCGAGGTAMITQPTQADTLGQATWQALQQNTLDCIISGNIGCRLHLTAMREAQGEPPHLHPPIPVLSPARFLHSRLRAGTPQPHI